MRGDTRDAVDNLTLALERCRSGEDLVVELNAMSQLSAAYGALGCMTESERLARKALNLEKEAGIRRLAMGEAARMMLALILRERANYDEARALLNNAIEVIRAAGDREDQSAQILYFYEQALIDAAEGDGSAAKQTMTAAIERARQLPFEDDSLWRIAGLQAHVHLLIGELDAGVRWAAQKEFPQEEPIEFLNEHPAITRTWIDLDRGEVESAERLIRRLVANLTQVGRAYRRAEAQLLLAAVCLRIGRQPEAESTVDEVVEFAARQRCKRILIDTHPSIRELLPDARKRATAAGIRWPLDDIQTEDDGTESLDQTKLAEPLTTRELEVLALLGTGVTNREVANQLFVSVGTVKRHTHNIYGKLGVKNRTQALIRSQELGLVDRD